MHSPLLYPPSLTDPSTPVLGQKSLFLSSLNWKAVQDVLVWELYRDDALWAPAKTKGRFLVGLPYVTSQCFALLLMSVAGGRLCRECQRNSSACGEEGLGFPMALWAQTTSMPGNMLTKGSGWPLWITFAGWSVLSSSVLMWSDVAVKMVCEVGQTENHEHEVYFMPSFGTRVGNYSYMWCRVEEFFNADFPKLYS